MLNNNDTKRIADNLEEILDRRVFPMELDVLSEKQRAYICSLIYRWTQGEEVKERIEGIINHPPKSKYSDKTMDYLKLKKII